MIKDEQMNVVVSGSSVYNAVKNYLNNSEVMQKQIQEAAQKLLDEGTLKKTLERQSQEVVNSYHFRHTIESEIRKAVNEVIQLKIKGIVEESVKNALKNTVLVVPKV